MNIYRPAMHIRKVYFHIKWLENFMFTNSPLNLDIMISKSEVPRDKSMRSVGFYILFKYAGASIIDIAERYGHSVVNVRDGKKLGERMDYDSKLKIIEALNPYLPFDQSIDI